MKDRDRDRRGHVGKCVGEGWSIRLPQTVRSLCICVWWVMVLSQTLKRLMNVATHYSYSLLLLTLLLTAHYICTHAESAHDFPLSFLKLKAKTRGNLIRI